MNTFPLVLILLVSSCAEPTAMSPRPATLRVAQQEQQNNSYAVDAAHNAVYIRLTQVRSEEGESIHAFVGRMFESADSANARRLVIDLRSIEGGDTRLLVPLIKGIVARDRFVQRGGLFLVVGPKSFSPSQNAATLLQQYANPILVAELPGSGPIS